MPIRRHIKVRGQRSPYDGDWLYWGTRGRCYPNLAPLKVFLLKQQRGKCYHCGLNFMLGDLIETHHLDGNHSNQRHKNLAVMHRHCHDLAHASRRSQ
ncbi:MAG: restriction endonuclease [Cyanobacteria bacterium J06639_14]